MENRTTIITCTFNRAPILHETLCSLFSQPSFKSKVIVSAATEDSVLPQTAALPGVTVIGYVIGSTKQRNAALRLVTTPYTLILDDDVEMDPGYIGSMERLFDANPGIAVATGEAVLDRFVTRSVVTREMALRALKNAKPLEGFRESVDLPGHNIFVRTEIAQKVWFDERLPLYALYEDIDFVNRCMLYGKSVRNREARISHLGVLTGRINEVRLGYSQFANPWYLLNKGTWGNGSLWAKRLTIVKQFWAGQFAKNLIKSFLPEGKDLVDRRSRLKGNVLAIADLLRGRLEPENILQL